MLAQLRAKLGKGYDEVSDCGENGQDWDRAREMGWGREKGGGGSEGRDHRAEALAREFVDGLAPKHPDARSLRSEE